MRLRLYDPELGQLRQLIYAYTRKTGVCPNRVTVHPRHAFAHFALALGLRVVKDERWPRDKMTVTVETTIYDDEAPLVSS